MKRVVSALLLTFALASSAQGQTLLQLHAGAYVSEAQSFFNTASGLGCTISVADKAIYNTLFRSLIADDLYSKLDILETPGLAPDECSAFINLVRPGFATGTEFGGITFYPYSGITGNKTDAYIDLGVGTSGLTQLAQNSAHMGVWTTALSPSSTNNNLGVISTPINMLATICSSGNVRAFRLTSTSSLNDGSCVPGLSTVDRTDSTHISTYENGVVKTAGAANTSTALGSNHLVILRGNSAAVFSGSTVVGWEVGSQLDATHELALYNDLNTAFLATGAVVPFDCSQTNSCLPAYFTAAMDADITPAGFRVAQQGNCPASNAIDNTTYTLFVQTVCQTQDMVAAAASTWTGGKVNHFIWANRYNSGHNSRPNPVFPADGVYRVTYSTIPLADCATKIKFSYSAGYADHEPALAPLPSGVQPGYLDIAAACGIPDANVWSYATFIANAPTSCTTASQGFLICLDIAWLPQAKIADIATTPIDGLTADWEVQDGHSSAQTTAAIADLTALAHGKNYGFTLYTNALDGANEFYNGIFGTGVSGANTDTLLGAVDYFNLLLASNVVVTTSLTNQVAQFAVPNYAKLQITWDMRNTAASAAAVKSVLTANGYAGVNFWRNGVALGGVCSLQTNQEISALSGVTGC